MLLFIRLNRRSCVIEPTFSKVDTHEVNLDNLEASNEPNKESEERGRRRYKKSSQFQLVNSDDGARKPPAVPKPSKKKYD